MSFLHSGCLHTDREIKGETTGTEGWRGNNTQKNHKPSPQSYLCFSSPLLLSCSHQVTFKHSPNFLGHPPCNKVTRFFKFTLANLAANKHKNRTAQRSGLWAVWFACYLYVCRCCVLIAIMMCGPHLSTKVNTRCGNIVFLHNIFFTWLHGAFSHACIRFFITEQIQSELSHEFLTENPVCRMQEISYCVVAFPHLEH